MIAKDAKKNIHEAVGIDYEQATIEYTQKNYSYPKVSYHLGDAIDQTL
ncbi:hypothetical protein M4D55_00150 [Metabacillus idriensis]|nr:hypothetical protein [Metabacillus idriensis]MCM3594193.1 hypothetical protein [Metabacillus idriensis]